MIKETGFQVGNRLVLPTPDPEQQPAGLRFSERMELAKRAVEWCKQHKVPTVAHNIITALDVMNLIKRTAPTGLATASELEQLARRTALELIGQSGAAREATILSSFQKVQELTRKADLEAAVKAAQSIGRPASKPDEPPTVQPDAGAATADKPLYEDLKHVVFTVLRSHGIEQRVTISACPTQRPASRSTE